MSRAPQNTLRPLEAAGNQYASGDAPKLRLKPAQSMPALNAAEDAQRKLNALKRHANDNSSDNVLSPQLARSKSMADIDDIAITWRNLLESIPFMAIPGVSNELTVFRRTVSTRRVTGRVPSFRHLLQSTSKRVPSITEESDTEYSVGTEEGSPIFGKALDSVFDEKPFTLALGLAMSTAVLSSFQVGYSSSAMNVPENVIREALHVTEVMWSVAVAIFALGALFGSLISGRIADTFGRKNFLVVNNVLFIVGGLCQALAYNDVMIIVARMLLGIGSGGATVVVPLYLGEIAPADLRGALGTANQFAMVMGILLAVVLGKPLGQPDTWRYLLGVPVLAAVLQLMFSPVLLESPLWLVNRGTSRALAHAEDILSQLRGEEDVSYDIDLMKRSRDAERQESYLHPQSTLQTLQQYRLAVFIGLFLQVAQQFSGINGVFYYSTSFFASAGVSDPWLGSVLACGVNVAATGLAIYLMDLAGRRVLLIVSALGMAVAAAVLTIALYYTTVYGTDTAPAPPATPEQIVQGAAAVLDTAAQAVTDNTAAFKQIWGYICVGGVLAFVSLFELGLGPIPWLIGAEIFPSRVRATAMTSISSVNWVANFAVGLSFPHINRLLGWLTFVPFGMMCIVAALFTIKFVPETKGKSFQQIQQEMGAQTQGQRQQQPHQGSRLNQGKQHAKKSYGSTQSTTTNGSSGHQQPSHGSLKAHRLSVEGPLAPLAEEYPGVTDVDLERGSADKDLQSYQNSGKVPVHTLQLHKRSTGDPNSLTSPPSDALSPPSDGTFEARVLSKLMAGQTTPDTVGDDDEEDAEPLSEAEAIEVARRTGLTFAPHFLAQPNSESPRPKSTPSPGLPPHAQSRSSPYHPSSGHQLPSMIGSASSSRQSSGHHGPSLPPSMIPVEASNSPLLARDPRSGTSPLISQVRNYRVSPAPSPSLSATNAMQRQRQSRRYSGDDTHK